jgi:hypothetical protein
MTPGNEEGQLSMPDGPGVAVRMVELSGTIMVAVTEWRGLTLQVMFWTIPKIMCFSAHG